MMGLLVVTGLALMGWGLQFVRDRGSLEHLLLRFADVHMAEVAGAVEQAGEHVRDVSLLRRAAIRPSIFIGDFGLIATALVALALVWAGVPPQAIAIALGLIAALQALTGNAILVAQGLGDMVEKREGREQMWFLVAVLAKVVLVTGAYWLILAGAQAINAALTWPAVGLVVVGLGLLSQSHVVSVWCLRRGRRHHHTPFASDADRELILLLRSFDDDDLSTRTAIEAGGLHTPPLPTARVRFEEFLVWLLRSFGKVVAIGRPGEGLPELGALRTYWSDDQWQEAIRLTATRCRAIVLVSASSEGITWELDRLRAWGLLGKTLVVLPPDPDPAGSQRRFVQAVTQLAPAGTSVADRFEPSLWMGLSVHRDGRLTHHISDGRDWAGYAAMVLGFFLQWTGKVDGLPDGLHADAIDRAEHITASATSIEEAVTMHAAEGPLVTPARTRRHYPQRKTEQVGVLQTLALAKMATRHDDLIEASRYDEALDALTELIGILDPTKTPVLVSLMLTRQGELAWRAGKSAAAEESFTASARLAASAQRRVNLFGQSWTPEEARREALRGLRSLAADHKEVAKALALGDEIALVSDEIGDREGILAAHIDSAGLLLTSDNATVADRAELGKRLTEVLGLARELGDIKKVGWASWHLGTLDERRGDLEAAAEHFGSAAAKAAELGEIQTHVTSALRHASVLATLNRPTEARAALLAAQEQLSAIADPAVRARETIRLTNSLKRLSNPDTDA